MDELPVKENEFKMLVDLLEESSAAWSTEASAEKTKVMTSTHDSGLYAHW